MKNPKTTNVQALLFDREHWTPRTAREWLSSHGFKAPASAFQKNFLRYRQTAPGAYQKGSFRTIDLDKAHHVKAIVGRPKQNPCDKVNPKKKLKGADTRTRPDRRSGKSGHPEKPKAKKKIKAKPKAKAQRKTNPDLTLPEAIVFLGEARELSIRSGDEIARHDWPRKKMFLASNIAGTRLFIFRKVNGRAIDYTHIKETKTLEQGKKLFKRFADFDSASARIVRVNTAKLSPIGEAVSLAYWSDKWRDDAEYLHTFDKPPRVFATAKVDLFVLIGAIAVKKEGIAG
jgi:hypothetical protein